jgi:predicted nucleic acid-binding protein
MSEALLVGDSGPLIALARLDLLAIPSGLFGELLVTATVWQEVLRGQREVEHARLLTASDKRLLRVVADPEQVPPALAEARLDDGERSALALALLHAAAVLVDERRGRACASELGLPVIGTLGLLVQAREAGLLTRLRPLTDALLESGYFLAQPLVDRMLVAVGE